SWWWWWWWWWWWSPRRRLDGFEYGDRQPVAGGRCGSESATQYASSQQPRRPLQRSPPEFGNNAVAARPGWRQHGNRSIACAEGRQSEHLRHGTLAIPVCRRHYKWDLQGGRRRWRSGRR